MKERHLQVKTKQSIRYINPSGYELHEETVKAVLRKLTTYSLLRYTNSKDQTVSVKWYEDREEIELKQPNGNFVFRLNEPTQTIYKTPAGVWQLEVATQSIQWKKEQDQLYLTVKYTLAIHEEKIGYYEFKLQYEQ